MLVRKWEFVNGFLKNNFLSISDKKKALFLFEMHLICTNLISSSVSGGTSCFAQKFLIFYGIFFIPFSTAASILCRTSKLSPELFLFFLYLHCPISSYLRSFSTCLVHPVLGLLIVHVNPWNRFSTPPLLFHSLDIPLFLL